MLDFPSDEPIFLRTHYDPDGDEKTEKWVSDACTNSSLKWLLHHTAVHQTIACHGISMPPERSSRTGLARKKHNKPDKWREDPHHFTEIAAAGLLRTVAAMYLPIADQGAFDTKGHLRLIYLDCKRNISKETSVEPDEVTNSDVIMEWFIRATPPESWEEGTTGDRYRIKGDLTRELY
ncbi:uncharacterized protein BDW43DRAFT_316915 [Aspergillus alliaceus]|uniref:uncharacterized protein n=1 Tax=Petromyces alliaceus TaxID=209559 RepID=UPI0012A43732|nr:uncharacterized protein BDW43DRAFT_316915 [Aspergillus alliaceus]KAB8227328.1 hypothetical protein BDW43DRAFT_316915 [Aspergillus alliaceus]